MSWMRMRPGTGNPPAGEPANIRYWRQMAIGQLKPNIKDEADAFKTYSDLANTLRGAGENQMAETMLAIARDESRHRITIEDLISKLEAKER